MYSKYSYRDSIQEVGTRTIGMDVAISFGGAPGKGPLPGELPVGMLIVPPAHLNKPIPS